jgi:hypothetical protein
VKHALLLIALPFAIVALFADVPVSSRVECAIGAIIPAAIAVGMEIAESRRAHPSESADVDFDAMLDAIAQVESGNNPRAVGQHGERSAYQMMESTWKSHTDLPFLLATQRPDMARMVARRHLEWLCAALRRMHTQLEPELIAGGWQAGPGCAYRFAHSDHARRVAALYREAVEAAAQEDCE